MLSIWGFGNEEDEEIRGTGPISVLQCSAVKCTHRRSTAGQCLVMGRDSHEASCSILAIVCHVTDAWLPHTSAQLLSLVLLGALLHPQPLALTPTTPHPLWFFPLNPTLKREGSGAPFAAYFLTLCLLVLAWCGLMWLLFFHFFLALSALLIEFVDPRTQ